MARAGPRGGVAARTGPSGGRLPLVVLLALLLSVVVIAVNSIASSSSRHRDVAVGYVDRVRPMIDASTRQGMALDDFRTRATELGPPGVARALERLTRDTSRSRDEVADLEAPAAMRDAHALLLACLTARLRAVRSMGEAIGALNEAPADRVAQDLAAAGLDLSVADRAYVLFVESLPEAARGLAPASRWLGDPDHWSRPQAAALVSSLRSSGSGSNVNDLAIVTFRTEPEAVAMEGPNPVLPVSRSMRLHVVVANVGNQAQRRVAVEAVVTSTGGMDTARQFVDLGPGERQTVTLTLRPAPVGTISLVVRAVAVAGESSIGDNERSWAFVMR